MPTGNHSRVIAACSGLCGFCVAIIAGIAVDNPLDVTLSRAILALMGCFALGMLVGAAAGHAFESRLIELQNVQREQSPAPALASSSSPPAAPAPPARPGAPAMASPAPTGAGSRAS